MVKALILSEMSSRQNIKSVFVYINKEKEITKSKNKDFLATLPNKWEVIKQFDGITRFEIKLETIGKIRSYLNLKDTYINDVLEADINPILAMYDKLFSNTSDIPNVQSSTYEDFAMQTILNAYHGDIKTIEMILKNLLCISLRIGQADGENPSNLGKDAK